MSVRSRKRRRRRRRLPGVLVSAETWEAISQNQAALRAYAAEVPLIDPETKRMWAENAYARDGAMTYERFVEAARLALAHPYGNPHECVELVHPNDFDLYAQAVAARAGNLDHLRTRTQLESARNTDAVKAAREELYAMARHAIRRVGLSGSEWATEPQTLALARKHGIEDEIDHIAACAGGR